MIHPSHSGLEFFVMSKATNTNSIRIIRCQNVAQNTCSIRILSFPFHNTHGAPPSMGIMNCVQMHLCICVCLAPLMHLGMRGKLLPNMYPSSCKFTLTRHHQIMCQNFKSNSSVESPCFVSRKSNGTDKKSVPMGTNFFWAHFGF